MDDSWAAGVDLAGMFGAGLDCVLVAGGGTKVGAGVGLVVGADDGGLLCTGALGAGDTTMGKTMPEWLSVGKLR